MDGKTEYTEEQRIDAISNCADMLKFSIGAMRTMSDDDENIVKDITRYINKMCEVLRYLGEGNVDEAKRSNDSLINEIERDMEIKIAECSRRDRQ